MKSGENPLIQTNRWIPLALFLGSVLFSAWLSPSFLGWSKASANTDQALLAAGIDGKTLLRSGEALDVKVGGESDPNHIIWALDGYRIGKAPGLHLQHLSDGEHTLSVTYRDARGQAFAASMLVRVMDAEPYAIQAAAIQAAIYLPLWEEDYQAYIPLVQH